MKTTWTSLPAPACPEWASVKLKADHAALMEAREAITSQRAEIDGTRAQFENIDPTKVCPADLAGADLRGEVMRVLQNEAEWRERFGTWLAAVYSASHTECDQARSDLEKLEAQVIRWLEKGFGGYGGYATFQRGGPVQGSWSLEMVARFPAVIAAKARCQDARCEWAGVHRNQNATGLQSVRDSLARMRSAMLAV